MSVDAAFDRAVPPGGYAWWYLDASSDDGLHGLTLIGFVGSVFSPYYAWRRGSGRGDALDHCAFNVALYGKGAQRWAMTERGRGALRRSADTLAIGPSEMRLTATGLAVQVDEIAVPVPRRVSGCVEVTFERAFDRPFLLDAAGRHRWRPIAPLARVEVVFDRPVMRWRGSAYLDTNWGEEPLERAFSGWQWSRTSAPSQGTKVYYDVRGIDGASRFIGVRFDPEGNVVPLERPPWSSLGATRWRIGRYVRTDRSQASVEVETLEDTPFYARTLIRRRGLDGVATTFHESLNLRRFSHPLVQWMLPFRMPRRA